VAWRVAVVVGSLAYVAGGGVGWGNPPAPGWPAARAHELAGVAGEWLWLGAGPMLAAGFAPFTRGWLRWLWITALPPLLYAVWVWRYSSVQGGAYGYPFFPNPADSTGDAFVRGRPWPVPARQWKANFIPGIDGFLATIEPIPADRRRLAEKHR
jgi:hypothetical protein